MTTRSGRNASRFLVLAVALALLLTGCGSSSPGPRASITQAVALGDSYAAGPGLNPVADVNCVRSGKNYGSLVAARLKVANYTDMTCGGAATKDLEGSQVNNSGVVINQPQLSAVSASTDLVTLGIGLNNNGFSAAVLYLCLPQFNLTAQCQAYLKQPESALLQAVVSIASDVKAAVESIKSLAPRARIILIGYPRALPDHGSCPARFPLTGEAAHRLTLALKSADTAYRAVAKAEKIGYISTYAASAGHDMCSAEPWANGVTDASGTGGGAALHPTPAFMKAVADLIVAQLAGK